MKSTGTVLFDNLPPLLVKLCPELFAHLLFILFSAIIHTLVYPDIWKSAFIRPLHKSDSKTDITNYRPNSLLPKTSLIFEKDIFDFKRLTEKLTKDSILRLLRDSLSHLKQAKSSSDRFSKLENKLHTLITNTETSPGVTPPSASSGKSTMADIFKASLDERDYNEQANKTIVFYNVEETKGVNGNVDPTIKDVFERIEQNLVMIESAYRLGKKSESNTRPRPLKLSYLLNSTRGKL